ncbi:MAG: cell envelope integrity protein CreD [Chitinophagales bacterium]
METNSSGFFDRFNNWMRNSVTLKLLMTGILILVLMIPGSMIESLVNEREELRQEAVKEVSSKWGDEQTISGPVISVPYSESYKDENNHEQIRTAYAHFLPSQLNIKAKLTPERRNRGIYVVMLYRSDVEISGTFDGLDGNAVGLANELRWNEAQLNLGITDMKGISENINIDVNGMKTEAQPGTTSSDIVTSGIHIPFTQPHHTASSFKVNLKLNGSSSFDVTPFGKETRLDVESSWGDPSFEGEFLPEKRAVTANAFSASWKVLQLNRNYPQAGTGAFISQPDAFGVRLLVPVDEYQKTMRSAKYSVMFVVITFLSFFFIEILNRKRIHTIQYLLVGFAVVLFYVLLLSISEHLNFDKAYWISCAAVLGLITFYAYFVFGNKKLTGVFSGILLILYLFFYSLLQLQDYSLLLGSIGLFLILAVVMFLTRKIDWYNWNR